MLINSVLTHVFLSQRYLPWIKRWSLAYEKSLIITFLKRYRAAQIISSQNTYIYIISLCSWSWKNFGIGIYCTDFQFLHFQLTPCLLWLLHQRCLSRRKICLCCAATATILKIQSSESLLLQNEKMRIVKFVWIITSNICMRQYGW